MIGLYYRIKLGTVLGFNHAVDDLVENYLKDCLKSEIKNISQVTEYGFTSDHRSMAEFDNGIKYFFWNSNKYYGWLSEGKFVQDDERIIYEYGTGRPTVKTMYAFKQAIENYRPPIVIETNPFNL